MSAARRRQKAINRRRWLRDLDAKAVFTTGRMPVYARAVSICPCGRIGWVNDLATDEELEQFRRDVEDHEATCDPSNAWEVA